MGGAVPAARQLAHMSGMRACKQRGWHGSRHVAHGQAPHAHRQQAQHGAVAARVRQDCLRVRGVCQGCVSVALQHAQAGLQAGGSTPTGKAIRQASQQGRSHIASRPSQQAPSPYRHGGLAVLGPVEGGMQAQKLRQGRWIVGKGAAAAARSYSTI